MRFASPSVFSRRPPVLDEEVIEWRKPARFSLPEIVEFLRSHLPAKVSEAYIFGSYARGEAHEDSDIDLIVVAETNQRWHQRSLEFSDALDALEPLDVLVYTPAEWQTERSAFLKRAACEWVRVR
jgi:predicted nucleotidyltransferase